MNISEMELLDIVLSYLGTNTTWQTLRQTFPESNITKDKLKALLRMLERDGLIDRFDGVVRLTNERGFVNSTKIIRNIAGDIFIAKGGYKIQGRKMQSKARWTLTKTIFEVIISIITVILTFISMHQANKIDKLQQENEKLNQKIEQLGGHQ